MYQQINRANLQMVGQPGAVASEVNGWPDTALRNLDATDARFGLRGTAFWPIVLTDPVYDAATETLTDEVLDRTVDASAFRVTANRGKRPLTPEEIAARRPPPAVLGKVEFITLVQMAGGMTDDMLVEAHTNPLFAAFWIKMQMASVVQRDYPTTAGGLDALAFAGYLPKGKAAVLAAWPTA
ncbi:hypothetical protein [Methylobacterium sp. J-090]|uniref:hypothetical protein n=1 Tax=Methylobacterium sp. J-090 TaxID=2836666 RepID=UPI001FB98A74|nr:hypothetical protein [Methylobacterium sp. J-090]MCJ2080757.1 hypothetical protein [Methylobacterium sp. J-090]